MGRVTQALVDNILDAWGRVTGTAIERTKELLIDQLGVAIAGSKTDEGNAVTALVGKLRRTGPATLLPGGSSVSPDLAALANGVMAYSIGMTDTHATSITHPGASVIPAALAIGETEKASGLDLIKAVIMGYEVVTRIGSAITPSHRMRGFHPTATCGVFGAATSSALLLRADRDRLTWALGIAGSMAGGLYEFRNGSAMTMALHGGWPAHGGVVAGYLASLGFTGPRSILEGDDGFLRAFADGSRTEEITRPIDGHFAVEDISLRPYCACRYAHSAIDAIQGIKKRRGGLDPARIDRITVATHKIAAEQEPHLTGLVAARLSTAFNVALAVVRGPQMTETTERDLHDAQVMDLYKRVKVVEEPRLTGLFPEKWAAKVSIQLKDGSLEEAEVHTPKGDPGNPLSRTDIVGKFKKLVSGIWTQERQDRILEMLSSLDRLSDVSGIFQDEKGCGHE